MKKLFLTTVMLAAVAVAMSAQRVVTTRPGNLQPAAVRPEVSSITAVADTAALDSLSVSAYDKPLRSLRETFFVTNNLASDTLTSLQLRLTYTASADSAMLHSRTAILPCDIPPAQTRQLYLIAWDRQYTYYSENTRIKPQSTKAVPYSTRIELLGATVKGSVKK